MSALDDLNAKADVLKTAIDAALAAMNDVKAKLDAALAAPALDAAAVKAISDKLDADIAEVNSITAVDAPAAPAA